MFAKVCPKCGKRFVYQTDTYCEYTSDKHGFYSGCGLRVAYNDKWRFCPICGKPISYIGSTKLARE